MIRRYSQGTNIADFDAVRLAVASPEDILDWSHGEVTKPETINYRTQKPERDGLFCERIFGPVKDINPHDAKYKGVRSREAAVDKNGEIVTKSIVRRERMGHISLAAPVAHIWFLRGTPSAIGLLLGMTVKNLERVSYFASYIIMKVNEDLKAEAMKRIESEFKSKMKAAKNDKEQESLKEMKEKEKNNLKSLRRYQILSELDYRDLSVKYGEVFEAGIGAESVRRLLEEANLEDMVSQLEGSVKNETNPLEIKKVSRRLKFLRLPAA